MRIASLPRMPSLTPSFPYDSHQSTRRSASGHRVEDAEAVAEHESLLAALDAVVENRMESCDLAEPPIIRW